MNDMNEGIGNQMNTNVINTDENDTIHIERTDSDDEIITDVNQYKTPNGVSDDGTTRIEGIDSDDEIITDVNQYKTPNGVSDDGTTRIEGIDSDDEIITDVNQYKTPNGVSDINDIDDLIHQQTPMEPNIADDEFVIGSDTL
eukprot:430407_1